MDKIYYSQTGREFFLKVSKECDNLLIHNRKCKKNQEDIYECAALSLHKAIIGVSQLSLLEDATEQFGNCFRQSIAVSVYYIVYHLFCACMLLDKGYKLIIKNSKKGVKPEELARKYEVPIEELNDTSESAETWNNCKDNEMDISTSITHNNIKWYCRTLRENILNRNILNRKPEFIKLLFEYFVRDDATGGVFLFEKMDYIRDRSIYRPSVVVLTNGSYAQTSLDVRKEIDSLPSSEDLYERIKSIITKIKAEIGGEFWFYFINNPINCKLEYLSKMGYSWDDAEKLKGDRKEGYVPSFAYQMIELFDNKTAVKLFEKYWSPLFDAE